MRQTLISIAILSALSLPGLASAEVGPFDTENRVNPPGTTPKGFTYQKIETVKDPKAGPGKTQGVVSPRDSASGLPTGRR